MNDDDFQRKLLGFVWCVLACWIEKNNCQFCRLDSKVNSIRWPQGMGGVIDASRCQPWPVATLKPFCILNGMWNSCGHGLVKPMRTMNGIELGIGEWKRKRNEHYTIRYLCVCDLILLIFFFGIFFSFSIISFIFVVYFNNGLIRIF